MLMVSFDTPELLVLYDDHSTSSKGKLCMQVELCCKGHLSMPSKRVFNSIQLNCKKLLLNLCKVIPNPDTPCSPPGHSPVHPPMQIETYEAMSLVDLIPIVVKYATAQKVNPTA